MTHPYSEFVSSEIARSEADLASFRDRAFKVVTTASAMVTLLTGAVTFGASKSEEDAGLPGFAIFFLVVAFVLLVCGAIVALTVNNTTKVRVPDIEWIVSEVEETPWPADDKSVAEIVKMRSLYLESLRLVADDAGDHLKWATWLQIGGLSFAAIAGAIATVALGS